MQLMRMTYEDLTKGGGEAKTRLRRGYLPGIFRPKALYQ